MLALILLLSCVIFWLAYRYYGNFLAKRCGLDDSIKTPAYCLEDGVDYVPTRASILFGHHFSSIAGAGPIVGPVLAALYFGWLPALIWIILGAIFVGGVHDFGSALMSIRHRGRSIAETTRELVGENTGKLFVLFVILAMIYVVIVFLDLTAKTFADNRSVATASGWFLVAALAFGYMILRTRIPFKFSVAIFVPLTFLGLWVGHVFPAPALDKNMWMALILVYCYVASIMPVNILLQPRDFLSATFLYAMLALGVLGLLVSGAPVQAASFTGWHHENAGALMPILFITVACGACSGFHSLVSSGTTSKQLRVESDIKRINYGGMLVEGVLAVLALCTFAVLSPAQLAEAQTPISIFARGATVFLSALHIPVDLAEEFVLLGISTFLLTTLDTCTRLCRFLLEELLNWRSRTSRYLGTLIVLAVPAVLAFQTINGTPMWQAIWPLFGATNQLMAALALVTLIVFLKGRNIKYGFVVAPALLMVIMPMSALIMMVDKEGITSMLGFIAAFMFILGLIVVGMSFKFIAIGQAPEPIGVG